MTELTRVATESIESLAWAVLTASGVVFGARALLISAGGVPGTGPGQPPSCDKIFIFAVVAMAAAQAACIARCLASPPEDQFECSSRCTLLTLYGWLIVIISYLACLIGELLERTL